MTRKILPRKYILILFFKGSPATVVPVNDIRGLEGMGYTKAEKQVKQSHF